MEESKVLSIDEQLYLYSERIKTGLLAIMQSEEYVGKQNAVCRKFLVSGGDETYDCFSKGGGFWRHVQNMDLLQEKEIIEVQSDPCMERKYAYLYRKIPVSQSTKECIEVCLDYLQNSNDWTYVKLLFSDGIRRYDEERREACFEHECSLMLTAKGKLVFHYGHIDKQIQLQNEMIGWPIWLRITANPFVEASYSFNGQNWIPVWQMHTGMKGRQQAGIYINSRVNPFFYEFYITQLQLCYNKMTHSLSTQMEMDERNFSSMLDVSQIPGELLPVSGEPLLEFCVELIEKNYYIRLKLDEYYVPQRDSYQKQSCVQFNYIYGYNRARRVFLLMGFQKHVVFSEIEFDKFVQAVQYKGSKLNPIIIYKYNSKHKPDHLDLDILIRMIRAYVSGENCCAVAGKKIIYYAANDTILYGVKSLKYLAESEELELLLTDVGVFYQLCEHYETMRNLLELMFSGQILQGGSYMEYQNRFQILQQLSESVIKLQSQYSIEPHPSIVDEIKKHLKEMYRKDLAVMKKLLKELEEKG